jgi:SagB-type dehydrogenase family enzyme
MVQKESRPLGHYFFQNTKYSTSGEMYQQDRYTHERSKYKSYPDATKVLLPREFNQFGENLVQCLEARRSRRKFSDSPLSLPELSFLLWASGGISQVQPNREYRTAPSAGGLYPIETYIAVGNVEGLAAGLYHWDVRDHAVELLKEGDVRPEISQAALDQKMFERAPAVLIWSAVVNRSAWKYRDRAFRYIFLDVGHIAAQFSLAAVAIGAGSCQVGAFYDDQISELLGIDGHDEVALYLTVVGR